MSIWPMAIFCLTLLAFLTSQRWRKHSTLATQIPKDKPFSIWKGLDQRDNSTGTYVVQSSSTSLSGDNNEANIQDDLPLDDERPATYTEIIEHKALEQTIEKLKAESRRSGRSIAQRESPFGNAPATSTPEIARAVTTLRQRRNSTYKHFQEADSYSARLYPSKNDDSELQSKASDLTLVRERFYVQTAFSFLMAAAALAIILSNTYDEQQKHWAYGTLGTILGYWLHTSR